MATALCCVCLMFVKRAEMSAQNIKRDIARNAPKHVAAVRMSVDECRRMAGDPKGMQRGMSAGATAH